MKKILAILILGTSIFNSYAQTTDYRTLQKDLLAKSEKQNTAGWSIFTGGIISALIGLNIDKDYSSDATKVQTNDIVGISGLAAIGVGLHLFNRSGRNARKSARLGLEYQSLNTPISLKPTPNKMPSISLKIPI